MILFDDDDDDEDDYDDDDDDELCSIKHSSYDNYFLENNSLFESIYGKNHVGKIKDLFYCYLFQDM